MNVIEAYVHNLIGGYPFVRRPVVAAYQRLCSIVPQKEFVAPHVLVARPGFFFGFHDKCPWSADSKLLLAHKFAPAHRWEDMKKPPLEVGYFLDDALGKFVTVGKTTAWNWQQGAMLQWLGDKPLIVFNNFNRDEPVTCVVDLGGTMTATISGHCCAITQDGKLGAGYSFDRMSYAATEYTYGRIYSSCHNLAAPENDGLYVMNFTDLSSHRIFSLHDISNIEPDKYMFQAYHYFTHCQFSPDGKRMSFYHRYSAHGRLHTRLITCNINGCDIRIYRGRDFSHYCWINENEILAFATINDRPGYYVVEDATGGFTKIGEGILVSDGHPSIVPGSTCFVSDTYPDRFRMQSLFLYDLASNTRIPLLKVRMPFRYRYGERCDFHPRYNRTGTKVCFDTVLENTRCLAVMDVPPRSSWSTEKAGQYPE